MAFSEVNICHVLCVSGDLFELFLVAVAVSGHGCGVSVEKLVN